MEENNQNQTDGKKNIVLPAIAVVAIIVGGFLFMSKTNKNTDIPSSLDTPISATPDESMQESTGSANATSGNIRQFTIEGNNFAFDTKTITVNKGDVVKIILNNTEGRHDLVIDEFNVSTQVLTAGQTDEVQFIADTAGSFEYYCSIEDHRAMGMVGQLIVK